MLYNIKVLNKISKKGLSLFKADKYKVAEEVENPDAALLRSFNMHSMELPASLKAVARAGAGVNNIPIERCSEKGIVVFNTPGANANAVKELTVAALFLSSRKLLESVRWTKEQKDAENLSELIEKGKSSFVGPEIKGKRLGVIGLGAIGVMVANAAHALGMEVEGYDPYISVDSAWGLSRSIKKALSLNSLLENADYITLHVPLSNNTKGMFNKSKFQLLKKGVRLLNFSRGELVNTADLVEALQDETIACYATDFPEKELLSFENVISFPHIGASTPESEENCALMAVRQLADFLEDGNIRNSVNFPSCDLPRASSYRITLAHMNIPNMVGQISTILANENINIHDMINKSREKLAYTIIDTDSEVPENIVEKLKGIDSMLRVRVL